MCDGCRKGNSPIFAVYSGEAYLKEISRKLHHRSIRKPLRSVRGGRISFVSLGPVRTNHEQAEGDVQRTPPKTSM